MMRGPIYVAGPTASGKSAVALFLAERFDGEIISVDSMQVYRGMDIGTAKPTAEQRKRVPHHLIDVAGIDETFDVARFLDLARQAENQIRERGRVPIYCGGTGLYFKALIAGLGSAPRGELALREELEATPLPQLLKELRDRDPATFERIDRSNLRRVVRAVEVIRMTGRPYSEVRADWAPLTPGENWFGLERDRCELVERIDARVDDMFARGLVEETRELLKRGLEKNRTAMQALGYRQIVQHLRREWDLAQTVDLVKQKTRQYAKRQMTWFRHQMTLRWVKVEPGSIPQEIAERITTSQPPATI